MDASAYLRVSSKAQDYPTQKFAIERAAAARGDTISVWYSEKMSGKTIDRPELTRLRADVQGGGVRKIYVYRLDRLTRSGITDTLQTVEEFRRHGCELVSIADGFDLNGPAAEIILAVLSWSSKMERLAIRDRVSAARERIEAEGGSWGRPKKFTPTQLAQVQQMHAEGRTIREIAVAVKAPRSTVGRAVKAFVGAPAVSVQS